VLVDSTKASEVVTCVVFRDGKRLCGRVGRWARSSLVKTEVKWSFRSSVFRLLSLYANPSFLSKDKRSYLSSWSLCSSTILLYPYVCLLTIKI
jgi:hypothetical protein